MFHPATLLLAWAGLAAVLPLFSLAALSVLLTAALLAAASLARIRTLTLVRRARWLLLSIALLFAFATPGVALPGVLGTAGLTADGVHLAGEHVARLLLILASLALLHEHLGTSGLVAGLYWLLAPLHHGLRERVVVRLMLVVEFVESANMRLGWRQWLGEGDIGPERLALVSRSAHWRDGLALLAVAGGMVALAW